MAVEVLPVYFFIFQPNLTLTLVETNELKKFFELAKNKFLKHLSLRCGLELGTLGLKASFHASGKLSL